MLLPDLPRPEAILTHESDLDGFVSGLLLQRLARQLFHFTPPLQAFHNHNWKQRNPSERSAWVCDFAFEPRLDRRDWVIIDHHTYEHPPRNAQLIHDPKLSAGALCYEICRTHGLENPALERLVHLNNVADLFLEDDPDFECAGDYANLVKTYGFWNLQTLIGGNLERLIDHPLLEVMEVKRRVENPIGFDWSKSNVTEISPTIGLVNTVIGNTNLIVHRLLEEKATPYTILLTLFRRGNGMILVSLRSRNGEALKVAEKLQGGGHPNACGAVLPRSVSQIPDALLYLRETLHPGPSQANSLQNLDALFEEIQAGQ